MGKKFWDVVPDEHGIGKHSGDKDTHLDPIHVFYHEASVDKYMPRAALFDLEPGVIGAVTQSRRSAISSSPGQHRRVQLRQELRAQLGLFRCAPPLRVCALRFLASRGCGGRPGGRSRYKIAELFEEYLLRRLCWIRRQLRSRLSRQRGSRGSPRRESHLRGRRRRDLRGGARLAGGPAPRIIVHGQDRWREDGPELR
jgi:hypothetical protein